MLHKTPSVAHVRSHRLAVATVSLTLLCSATSVSATVSPAAETKTAIYLADLLRSARTVIATHQAHINNPDIGDKGLTGRVVLRKSREIFRQRTGKPLPLRDVNDLRTRLLWAQLASIREVMD